MPFIQAQISRECFGLILKSLPDAFAKRSVSYFSS